MAERPTVPGLARLGQPGAVLTGWSLREVARVFTDGLRYGEEGPDRIPPSREHRALAAYLRQEAELLGDFVPVPVVLEVLDCDLPSARIGSAEAARVLRVDPRHVRRMAGIDGQQLAPRGPWTFDRSKVERLAEERHRS